MKKLDGIVLNIPHASTDLHTAKYEAEEGRLDYILEKWTDLYTDKIFSSEKSNIISVISKYSRFYCDCERLIIDPLNTNGNGIYYTEFDGMHRVYSEFEAEEVYRYYLSHISDLRREINKFEGRDVLLLDCHSFPEDFGDVDICIGFNDDESKPEKELIDLFVEHFNQYGLKVGINNPYSNSFYPKCDFPYKSIMIEINKKVYLSNNKESEKKLDYIKNIIAELYDKIIIAKTKSTSF